MVFQTNHRLNFVGPSLRFGSRLDFRPHFHFQIINPIFFILQISSPYFYSPRHFILPFGYPLSYFKFVLADFWSCLILFLLIIVFTTHFKYPFLIMHYFGVEIQLNEETIKVTYDTFPNKDGTIDHTGI